MEEAIMVQPTETEGIEDLDILLDTFKKGVGEINSKPELLINAPINTETRRVDELKALKELIFKECKCIIWKKNLF